MLDNFLRGEEETGVNVAAVLEKDAGKSTEEACEQQGGFKVYSNKKRI